MGVEWGLLNTRTKTQLDLGKRYGLLDADLSLAPHAMVPQLEEATRRCGGTDYDGDEMWGHNYTVACYVAWFVRHGTLWQGEPIDTASTIDACEVCADCCDDDRMWEWPVVGARCWWPDDTKCMIEAVAARYALGCAPVTPR